MLAQLTSSIYGAGIRTHDLWNVKSPPITTWPGVPIQLPNCLLTCFVGIDELGRGLDVKWRAQLCCRRRCCRWCGSGCDGADATNTFVDRKIDVNDKMNSVGGRMSPSELSRQPDVRMSNCREVKASAHLLSCYPEFGPTNPYIRTWNRNNLSFGWYRT